MPSSTDHDSHAKWFHAAVPGSELRLIPGAGHMFHYAVPDQVAEAIEAVSTSSAEPLQSTTRLASAAE